MSALALVWASAATAYLLTRAGYGGVTTGYAAAARAEAGQIPISLVSTNGPWIVGLLLVVTLLAGLPTGVGLTHPSGQRVVSWIVGLLLLGFSMIGGFTVGFPYLPVAVLILLAAWSSPHVERDPPVVVGRGAR